MVLAAVAGGCTETHPVASPVDYVPRRVVEVERFAVHDGGELLGTLVHLEIQDPQGPLRFWRVENRSGAWLGHASEALRWSRRVPFRDDEEDLGVWPMARGVAQLVGRPDAALELRALPVAAPAAADRAR